MSEHIDYTKPFVIRSGPVRTDRPDWEAAKRARKALDEAYAKTPEEHFPGRHSAGQKKDGAGGR